MKNKVDQRMVRITRESAQRYRVAIAGIATEVICDCLADAMAAAYALVSN